MYKFKTMSLKRLRKREPV